MSIKDIIKNITTYVYMEAENIPSDVVKALDAAMDAVKKCDKYKWHDLRENPEDLPKVGKYVMCACQGNQYQVMRMHDDKDWITWQTIIYMHPFVIAWREIEPFEEEE